MHDKLALVLPVRFALALAVPLLSAALVAQPFFVSTTGSDANSGSIGSPWRTLTFAAATASSGSTINVAAGNYGTAGFLEGIEISAGKTLTFVGAGLGQTIVAANAGFSPTIPYRAGTRAWSGVFLVHGTGTVVDVRDMTLDAMHLAVPFLACMVYSDGAGGTVRRVEMRNAGAAVPDGAQGHIGIIGVGRTATSSTLDLVDCWIHHWNKTGVVFGADGITGSVIGCTIEGSGRLGSGQAAQNCIQLGPGGGSFTVKNNLIRDAWYSPTSWNAVGVILFDVSGTNTVICNRILSCKTGFYQFMATGTSAFESNELANCRWGLNIFSPGGTAKSNDFDADISVYVDGANPFTLDENSYSDFRTNGGWPTTFVAAGNAAVQDLNPVKKCPGFKIAVDVSLPAGAGPTSVVTGDFNGDGKPDFASANAGANTVTVHFGSGGTDFTTIPSKTLAMAGGPKALTTGEFSGSAGLDLAVLANDGKVYVLANDGSGTFAFGAPFDLDGTANDSRPYGIASGQLNAADEDDLVVSFTGDAVFKNGGVQVLLVDTTALTAGVAVPGMLRGVRGVALADLNNDGRLDLLAVDTTTTLGVSDQLQVWLHSATAGTFAAPTGYAITADGRGVTAGDLDQDGNLDVAVACASVPGLVHVWEGSASGALTPATRSPFRVDSDPTELAILALQGGSNDRVDLVTLHRSTSKATVLADYQGGRFLDYEGCATGLAPRSLAFAQLDADLLPDLLVANRGDATVSVYLGDPGALAAPYGVGCLGTGGLVPEAFAYGCPAKPALGNATFGLGVRKARQLSLCVMLMAVNQVVTNTACTVQIDFGTLFFAPRVLSNLAGEARVGLPVPNLASASGVELFVQWGVFDPLGGFLGVFAISDGMRLRLGN